MIWKTGVWFGQRGMAWLRVKTSWDESKGSRVVESWLMRFPLVGWLDSPLKTWTQPSHLILLTDTNTTTSYDFLLSSRLLSLLLDTQLTTNLNSPAWTSWTTLILLSLHWISRRPNPPSSITLLQQPCLYISNISARSCPAFRINLSTKTCHPCHLKWN